MTHIRTGQNYKVHSHPQVDTSVSCLLLSISLSSIMNTFEEVAQVWFSLIQWGFSVFVADAHLGTISYQVLRGREAPKKEMSMLSLRGCPA